MTLKDNSPHSALHPSLSCLTDMPPPSPLCTIRILSIPPALVIHSRHTASRTGLMMTFYTPPPPPQSHHYTQACPSSPSHTVNTPLVGWDSDDIHTCGFCHIYLKFSFPHEFISQRRQPLYINIYFSGVH